MNRTPEWRELYSRHSAVGTFVYGGSCARRIPTSHLTRPRSRAKKSTNTQPQYSPPRWNTLKRNTIIVCVCSVSVMVGNKRKLSDVCLFRFACVGTSIHFPHRRGGICPHKRANKLSKGKMNRGTQLAGLKTPITSIIAISFYMTTPIWRFCHIAPRRDIKGKEKPWF